MANSDLNLIANEGPSAFKARTLSAPGPSQRFGTIAHHAILEPAVFAERYSVKPKGLRSGTAKHEQWTSEHADKEHISDAEYRHLVGMAKAVTKCKEASSLFRQGSPEQCLFHVDAHGTERKARLDWLGHGPTLADLKTTSDASPTGFQESISRYRYDAQAAYYLDICAMEGLHKHNFVFVAVEKKPPYRVQTHWLTPGQIMEGRAKYEASLAIYRRCVETGEWPDKVKNYTKGLLACEY